MKILVACEFSGIVRDEFRKKGHDAWSCDLIPSEGSNWHHILGDVRDELDTRWDMLIAFPPCTFLANSGNRWLLEPGRLQMRIEAIHFVRELMEAPIHFIAIENPIGVLSTAIRKPSQIIQPWQFGHGEVKATCLWLDNLPLLRPTKIVEGRIPRVHREAPGPERWKNRSRTFPGIARAMAEQWGYLK